MALEGSMMQGEQAYAQQKRMIVSAAIAVALVLAGAFAILLWVDRKSRLEQVERQAFIQADATARLVAARIRGVERALVSTSEQLDQIQHLVSGGQGEKQARLALQRLADSNPLLVDMSVVDDGGTLLLGMRGDPDFYYWATTSPAASEQSRLYVGPLRGRSDGGWELPMALPMAADRWLLARLEGRELQALMSSSQLGAGDAQVLVDDNGLVLADSRGDERLGRLLLHSEAGVALEENSVARVTASSGVEGVPLTVQVGRARDEALSGWWRYLTGATLIYLLYLVGVGYLLYVVRSNYLRQWRLRDELRSGAAELALANRLGRVSTWTSNGTSLHWSQAAAQIYGVDQTSAQVEALFARIHRDDVATVRAHWKQAWEGGVLDCIFRLVLPGGVTRWISVRAERVDDDRGLMTGAAVDVTERHQAQERAKEAERQFRLLFDRNPVPIWLFDSDNLRFLEVNQAAEKQYGYTREEFLSMTVLDIRPQDEWAEVRETIRLGLQGVMREPRVRLHRRKDGSLLSVQAQTALLEFSGYNAWLVLAVDVTERLAHERDLAYRASHHAETGLLTRRALAETLDIRERAFAIAHIQVRGLQMVSDTLGHSVGEHVLRTVASRLGGLGGRYGLLAYQPGEDFILAIKGRYEVDRVIEHLTEVVSEPVRGPDSYHQFRAHIGVEVCSDGKSPAEEVMARAAQAAHAAREEGVLVKHHDARMALGLTERLHLAARIHSAIELGQFELFFQPICEARSGRPVMVEALIRWPQADGSWVAPNQFIPLAEDTGQMIALGRWVIRAAARAQKQLAQAGWTNLQVAVNVSAVQFQDEDLVGEFVRACEDVGITPDALQVELTESSLMRDPERGLEAMRRLHEQGISIALDDFGTGFSSMSYLQKLPLDALKIDRSFLIDVEHNPRSAAICQALLSLGQGLELQVVAEGVETEGQREWMRARGCDLLQGYLLARPVSLSGLIAWLENTQTTV